MHNLMLAGRSILVIEQQPFVTRCLQILLEGAGAELHCAATAADALRVIDRNVLSAAVLDGSESAKGRRRIAQQLALFGLPFVVCKDPDHDELWPDAPVLIKPVIGSQLVETLYRLIQARDAGTRTPGAAPALQSAPLKVETREPKLAAPKEIYNGQS